MSPDMKKVETLLQADPPLNSSELRSFLGMTNYSAPFIDNYSSNMAKLRELLKNEAEWNWTNDHQMAFEILRKSLSEETVLSYYDVMGHTKVICDASPLGLGCNARS